MPHFRFEQPVQQLDKQKGGYYYLKVDASYVNQYEKKRATRLICTIDGKVSYACGLNHYGDGNYFIILATRNFKKLGKNTGDLVSFEISEDPNPLGVEIPEVLQVLLDQDSQAKATYDSMTDGRKRTLIYTIKPVKDIDRQVQKILSFLEEHRMKKRSS